MAYFYRIQWKIMVWVEWNVSWIWYNFQFWLISYFIVLKENYYWLYVQSTLMFIPTKLYLLLSTHETLNICWNGTVLWMTLSYIMISKQLFHLKEERVKPKCSFLLCDMNSLLRYLCKFVVSKIVIHLHIWWRGSSIVM